MQWHRALLADQDRDGVDSVACGGTDCDDQDPNRFPGNAEVCDENAHDEDCDGATVGFDFDGDGYFGDRCCNDVDGELTCGTDCDDLAGTTFPGAMDTCNGADDDCDGDVDEESTLTFYYDADGDGFGLDGPDLEPAKQPITGCERPDGYALIPGDCNDESAFAQPGGTERCTPPGIDEDCDGEIDEYGEEAASPAVDPNVYYRDADGDGYGQPFDVQVACAPPAGFTLIPGDCRDDLVEAHPGAALSRTPACPPSWDTGWMIRDVIPMVCSGRWYCVDYAIECGEIISGSRYVPHWDLNCDGDVTGMDTVTCEGGCAPITRGEILVETDPLRDCGTGSGYFTDDYGCNGFTCVVEGDGPGTRPCR